MWSWCARFILRRALDGQGRGWWRAGQPLGAGSARSRQGEDEQDDAGPAAAGSEVQHGVSGADGGRPCSAVEVEAVPLPSGAFGGRWCRRGRCSRAVAASRAGRLRGRRSRTRSGPRRTHAGAGSSGRRGTPGPQEARGLRVADPVFAAGPATVAQFQVGQLPSRGVCREGRQPVAIDVQKARGAWMGSPFADDDAHGRTKNGGPTGR